MTAPAFRGLTIADEINFETFLQVISKPPLKPNLPTSLKLGRDKLRWIEEANPRNWGPALKEWGLSVAKK
jgi:hypothetical protein